MHIPDNYLSPQTDAVMAVAMVPVWVHCIKKVRATLDREHMAFLGICAAFSFLLMMFNVPLPGGTTGHAVGGALIALLLGPEAAAIAVSVALALQALLFGDGGVLSFGANCFNMAFVLPFVAAIVFRALNSRLHDKSWGTSVSAIVSGWVGLCLAALCAAIEFGIQPMLFTNASGAPLYCPFPLSVAIPAMLIPHMLVAGVIEGVATAAIYGFIKKTAPSVIVGPEAVDGQLAAEGAAAKKTSLVPTLILVAVLVVATPLGLLATVTPGASGTPRAPRPPFRRLATTACRLRSVSTLRRLPIHCPRAIIFRPIPRSRVLALPARLPCISFPV
ncbi:MAG: cobalt transporter CbiM [Collinsella sp.]